MPHSTKYIDS